MRCRVIPGLLQHLHSAPHGAAGANVYPPWADLTCRPFQREMGDSVSQAAQPAALPASNPAQLISRHVQSPTRD